MRRAIFLIHLVTGCIAGLVILFLALTGSVLTYERQIVAKLESGYHSTPLSEDAPRLSLETLLSTAASAKGEAPSAVMISSDRRAPVEVEFGHGERVLFDCYSGAMLGSGATRARRFFDSVTTLHRYFGASGQNKPAARAIKGVFDLALLLMIVTGLILWWPKTWSWARFKAGALLRFGLTGKAHYWNRHNVIGIWAALPLAIIVITGAILSYGWATNLLYRIAGNPPPAHVHTEKTDKHGKRHDNPNPVVKISTDQMFRDAADRAIGWHSLRTTLPKSSENTMTVTADFYDGSRPDRKVELLFDRTSGKLLQYNAFSSYSLGMRLRLFAHMVHTGEAGGILGQTIIGWASLSCCALVWTGFMLAIRRARTAWETRSQRKPFETAPGRFGAEIRPDRTAFPTSKF